MVDKYLNVILINFAANWLSKQLIAQSFELNRWLKCQPLVQFVLRFVIYNNSIIN